MIFSRIRSAAFVVGTALAMAAVSANATTTQLSTPGGSLALSFQDLGPGSTFTATNNNSVFTSGTGSAFYGDSFTAPTTAITASPGSAWGFYDDFEFTVPTGVAADTITSYIDLTNPTNPSQQLLGLSNLEVRLYSATANTTPTLGTPNGGVVPGASWSTPISAGQSGSGEIQVLDTTLAAGTYYLEVRGNVTGSSGGSYNGSLNIAPVPLPAGLPLLLSGLGALGGLVRRRSKQ